TSRPVSPGARGLAEERRNEAGASASRRCVSRRGTRPHPSILESSMADTPRVVRSTLCQGAAFLLVGLVWGLAVAKRPLPRLALGAHLQLTSHGVMFLVAGLVIGHAGLGTGRIAARILTAAPWLTWPVALSEMANAWWGTREMLPVSAQQAGATGGSAWQEGVVTAAHVVGALALIAYWGTILRGLLRGSDASASKHA